MKPEKPNQLQLSPEDLAKVERTKARVEGDKVSPEMMFVSRFGKHYGWDGVKAIMENKIDLDTAIALSRGAEKVEASKVIDYANATYVAMIASRSKKGNQVMKKGLDSYIKIARTGS